MTSPSGSSRKVISLGKASYAIILPKEWVVAQHIEKGSDVLLFPQRNGQIIIQKTQAPKTKVVLDASKFDEELLDAAIQSTYILNIDKTVIKFAEKDNLDDKMNHLADVSKKFAGMNLANLPLDTKEDSRSKETIRKEVVISNIVDMLKLKVNDIFDELLSILSLLIEQIERQDFTRDNSSQMAQMEGKYRLGVRLLIFALRNQHLEFEAGMSDIIQVLGSRVALRAMRSMIVQLNNIIPYLKTAEVPNLPVCMKYYRKLSQQAVKCLHETEIFSITQITEFWNELKAQVNKINDPAGTVRNYFENYFEIIRSFKEVAVTRHVERLEEILEEP